MPRHGEIDKNNSPHVGGNTWAGGTGGSMTAGLGGYGGPYRLASGHPIHQVPDEFKASVPTAISEAAKGKSSVCFPFGLAIGSYGNGKS